MMASALCLVQMSGPSRLDCGVIVFECIHRVSEKKHPLVLLAISRGIVV